MAKPSKAWFHIPLARFSKETSEGQASGELMGRMARFVGALRRGLLVDWPSAADRLLTDSSPADEEEPTCGAMTTAVFHRGARSAQEPSRAASGDLALCPTAALAAGRRLRHPIEAS